MAEREKTPKSSTVSTASAPQEGTEHIADEAARYLPIEDIVNVEPTDPLTLLFDEADALFGKRSTVEDSHDRYGKS